MKTLMNLGVGAVLPEVGEGGGLCSSLKEYGVLPPTNLTSEVWGQSHSKQSTFCMGSNFSNYMEEVSIRWGQKKCCLRRGIQK